MTRLGEAAAVTAAFAIPVAAVDLTLSRRGRRTISRVWWDCLEPPDRWLPYAVGATLGLHLFRRARWPHAITAGVAVGVAVLGTDRRLVSRVHVP